MEKETYSLENYVKLQYEYNKLQVECNLYRDSAIQAISEKIDYDICEFLDDQPEVLVDGLDLYKMFQTYGGKEIFATCLRYKMPYREIPTIITDMLYRHPKAIEILKKNQEDEENTTNED